MNDDDIRHYLLTMRDPTRSVVIYSGHNAEVRRRLAAAVYAGPEVAVACATSRTGRN